MVDTNHSLVIADRIQANERGTRTPWFSIATLVLIATAAIGAPLLAPFDPAEQLDITRLKNALPSSENLLGTDAFARDILSRLLHGARTSIFVATIATFTALTTGAVWGMFSASAASPVAAAMRIAADAFRSLPRILVFLTVFVIAGAMTPLMLACTIGLSLFPVTAQVAHAETSAIRSSMFIEAARASGGSTWRILSRQVLPHLKGPLSATAVLLLADVIAVEAGLSFVGLGVRPPNATWGGMVQDAMPFLQSAWWVAMVPCLALVATVLSLSGIANWLDMRRVAPSARESAWREELTSRHSTVRQVPASPLSGLEKVA